MLSFVTLIVPFRIGGMIGCARIIGGVYYFVEVSTSHKQVQRLSSVSSSSVKEIIMLWHMRLGHSNFFYLKYLFPYLFKGLNCSFFQWESRIFAKHHRSTYLPKPYKVSSPISLIHTDVWGLSKVLTHNGKCWFVTFIDDHTHLTWLYLLTNKLKIKEVYVRFYTMIEIEIIVRFMFMHTLEQLILMQFIAF